MSSEKASFAAMASQVWNQRTVEKKEFSIQFKADNTSNDEKNTTTTNTTKPSFVFGSNLAARCAQADESKRNAPKSAAEILQSFSKSNTNAFTSSANGASTSTTASTSADCDWKIPKDTEPKEQEETEKPITGEEDERNIFQGSCKFFQYDSEAKIWRERGPGILRLNENNDFEHNNPARFRLVARSGGSQKVLINSPLFYEMVFEAVSEKRVKISAKAPDSELPQLFLIQSSPALIGQLKMLLRQRLGKMETNAIEVALPRKRKASENEGEGDFKRQQNGEANKSSGGEASGEDSTNESEGYES